jgi:hypothetical protein
MAAQKGNGELNDADQYPRPKKAAPSDTLLRSALQISRRLFQVVCKRRSDAH